MDVAEKFGRIIIPMCTAFKEDYSINYDLTNKVARYLVKEKLCDSLIVAGTNGEFYTMSFEEKVNLFIAFFGRDKRLKNPLPAVKAAFEITSGLSVSRVRSPLMELEEDEIETLKESLRIVGKL